MSQTPWAAIRFRDISPRANCPRPTHPQSCGPVVTLGRFAEALREVVTLPGAEGLHPLLEGDGDPRRGAVTETLAPRARIRTGAPRATNGFGSRRRSH